MDGNKNEDRTLADQGFRSSCTQTAHRPNKTTIDKLAGINQQNQSPEYAQATYHFWPALLAIILTLCFLSCAGQQTSSTSSRPLPRPFIDPAWELQIIETDVSAYPDVRLRGVVLDSAGDIVKNLAPPYGHLDDWHLIWVPLVQRHPMWGEHELLDFKVTETQFEGIDTTRYRALIREKKEIELQLQQGEDRYHDVIARVEARKAQLPDSVLASMKNTSIVVVMDVSGSMSGEPLAKAKMAAAELLEFSEADIAVIAFDNQVYEKISFSRDKERLTNAVLSLTSQGGTHLYNALYRAINMLRGRSGEKHILALTDGATGGDRYSLAEIINFANSGDVSVVAQTGDHTKLFTIGLGYRGTNLNELAARTGGKYYFADNPSQVIEIFSDYIGFKLEQTRRPQDLHDQLARVNRALEQLQANIFKHYHYDISFTSHFPTEDGLDLQVSFKFGTRRIDSSVPIPVSQRELFARGYVVDDVTLERIANARVTVKPQMIDTTYTVTTDSNGYFARRIVRTPNKYSVFAEADGYFISAEEHRWARPDSFFVTVQLKLRKAEVGVKTALRTVHFENNEFLFEPVSFPDLVEMADYFLRHPEFKIEIAGHTDSYGGESYNQWLSEKRAEAVAEFFASLGVREENMQVMGYGESRPLAPDTNEENRYMNRRVEISLIELREQIADK